MQAEKPTVVKAHKDSISLKIGSQNDQKPNEDFQSPFNPALLDIMTSQSNRRLQLATSTGDPQTRAGLATSTRAITSYIENQLVNYKTGYFHVVFEQLLLRAALLGSEVDRSAAIVAVNSAGKIVGVSEAAKEKRIVPYLTSLEHAKASCSGLVVLHVDVGAVQSVTDTLDRILSSVGDIADKGERRPLYSRCVRLPDSEISSEEWNSSALQRKMNHVSELVVEKLGFPIKIGFGHSKVIAKVAAEKGLQLELTLNPGLKTTDYLLRLMQDLDLFSFPEVGVDTLSQVKQAAGSSQMLQVKASLPLVLEHLKDRADKCRMIACYAFGVDPDPSLAWPVLCDKYAAMADPRTTPMDEKHEKMADSVSAALPKIGASIEEKMSGNFAQEGKIKTNKAVWRSKPKEKFLPITIGSSGAWIQAMYKHPRGSLTWELVPAVFKSLLAAALKKLTEDQRRPCHLTLQAFNH